MKFEVVKNSTKSRARAGKIITAHGEIETPVFMPVGTLGTIKSLTPQQVSAQGAQIILANTYHLFLRPGLEIIKKAGGLHNFMCWPKPLLTDSGGFQVFSLSKLRKIDDDGVEFTSPLDGGLKHKLTPELVVEIQRAIGSDIMMPLDWCIEHDAPKKEVESALEITTRWAKRAKVHFEKDYPEKQQALFGIVQGGMFEDLRTRSATELIELDFPGYAIGGVSVGESKEDLYRISEHTAPLLPANKPRYLMGVGMPQNLEKCIRYGVDMFDAVLPTRLARHNTVFSPDGELNLLNAKFKEDFSPLVTGCSCYACQNFSRAYISHLARSKEILGIVLMTIHNINFLINLVAKIREGILTGEI